MILPWFLVYGRQSGLISCFIFQPIIFPGTDIQLQTNYFESTFDFFDLPTLCYSPTNILKSDETLKSIEVGEIVSGHHCTGREQFRRWQMVTSGNDCSCNWRNKRNQVALSLSLSLSLSQASKFRG